MNTAPTDGDRIYRTYDTTRRGMDRLLFADNILDLMPAGRQQGWEDPPPGWTQRPTDGWARPVASAAPALNSVGPDDMMGRWSPPEWTAGSGRSG
jgi:hypothetical protein